MFIRCLEIIDLYSTWSNQSNFSFHLPIWLFRSCCTFNSWNFINYMETSLFLDRNVLNYSHTTVFQSHPALFDARGDHYVLGFFCFVFFNILYFFLILTVCIGGQSTCGSYSTVRSLSPQLDHKLFIWLLHKSHFSTNSAKYSENWGSAVLFA